MRTTLNLEDDVAEAARALARIEGRSLGAVVSDLVRRGLAPRADRIGGADHAFPVFQVTPDAAPITDDMVQAALDEP